MKPFKTQDDLLEHYWSVIVPMCRKYNSEHGTDVKPWECVINPLICGSEYTDHPRFAEEPEVYKFALTILEGKPVFVGAVVHLRLSGQVYTVTENINISNIEKNFTWTPPFPKRTFMLNGMELPCPVKDGGYDALIVYGEVFYFNNVSDSDKWRSAFKNILTEARDKE